MQNSFPSQNATFPTHCNTRRLVSTFFFQFKENKGKKLSLKLSIILCFLFMPGTDLYSANILDLYLAYF